MIPDDRAQQLIMAKDAKGAQAWCDEYGYDEGWAIIDSCLVVYDLTDPPWWLPERDDNGNSIQPAKEFAHGPQET